MSGLGPLSSDLSLLSSPWGMSAETVREDRLKTLSVGMWPSTVKLSQWAIEMQEWNWPLSRKSHLSSLKNDTWSSRIKTEMEGGRLPSLQGILKLRLPSESCWRNKYIFINWAYFFLFRGVPNHRMILKNASFGELGYLMVNILQA